MCQVSIEKPEFKELTTSEIGKLVSVTGVVTWTSEVRPKLLNGSLKCLECGEVINNVEQQFNQQYVYKQPVTSEQSGHCCAKRANLLIGKRSECRRHPKRYLQAVCLGAVVVIDLPYHLVFIANSVQARELDEVQQMRNTQESRFLCQTCPE
ncbi:DNA replication licensing factor MCM6-like, partial [Trifolium medium]|nr:DNA replication licensing factor MCM6-like [Trifolium medium]